MTKVVFILGAGASLHYGFPTGQELVSRILRRTKHPIFNYIFKEMFFISDLLKIRKFYKEISSHKPLSIDSFISRFSHDKEFIRIGKNLIRNEIISSQHRRRMSDKDWYKLLPKVSSEFETNFITFNYDLSLEYFFWCSVGFAYNNKEKFGNSDPVKEAALDLLLSKITHVYGSVYDYKEVHNKCNRIPTPVFSAYSYTADVTMPASGRMARYIDEVKGDIRIIGEERASDEIHIKSIRDRICEAEKLVILGFGFDKTNIEILGLDKLTGSRSLKEVYYTNFNDLESINSAADLVFSGLDSKITKSIKSVYEAISEDFYQLFLPIHT